MNRYIIISYTLKDILRGQDWRCSNSKFCLFFLCQSLYSYSYNLGIIFWEWADQNIK